MTDNKEAELVKQLRARAASEDEGGNEAAAERAMMGMEAQSDLWADRVNLNDLIETIVNVGRLKSGTPKDVRESFIKRQRELIDALMRQSYLEGYLEGGLARKAYDANLDCQTADMIEALSRRPAATSEAVSGDYVLVPRTALDWLYGSGPDADGKWFGEVEEAFPTIKALNDRQPPFWWRVHFRKLIEAAPASPDRQTRDGALEEAAKLIDENQLVESSSGQSIAPRFDGNLAGLGYAAAIRALKSTLPAVEKEQDGWNGPDMVPQQPRGTARSYIVAVRRQHSGLVWSFPAQYLHALPLRYEQDEGDERETTGWYREEADGDDGSSYRILLDTQGDELVGWCEVPLHVLDHRRSPPPPTQSGDAK